MAKTPRSQGSSPRKEGTPPFVDPPARRATPEPAVEEEWSLDEGPSEAGQDSVIAPGIAIPGSRTPRPASAQEETSPQSEFESNPSSPSGREKEKGKEPPVRASARIRLKRGEEPEDAFDMGSEKLPELERPAAAPVPESAISEAERNDFADAGKAAEPKEKAARPAWERLSLLGACAVTALTAVAILWSLLAHGPDAVAAPSNSHPSLPMRGATATIAGADAYWRSRTASDRVSGIEVTLPVPERVESSILPEVKFTLDPGSSKTGFIRVGFMNSAREITGDVRVLKVVNGKFEPMHQGETIVSPSEAVVYGSIGFTDRLNYLGYTSGDAPRWYVEVRESADYGANEDGWKKLDAFDMPNVLKD